MQFDDSFVVIFFFSLVKIYQILNFEQQLQQQCITQCMKTSYIDDGASEATTKNISAVNSQERMKVRWVDLVIHLSFNQTIITL
jgi:hypothetical protein